MNRVVILQLARLQSERMPNKPLALVGGERLIDRGLKYMQAMSDMGAKPLLACHPKDEDLVQAAMMHGVQVVDMPESAVAGETWEECFNPIADEVARHGDWVFNANFLCRPFLRYQTGWRVVNYLKSTKLPFVCVQRHRGMVWSSSGTPVIGHRCTANTKTNPEYWDLAHIGYGVPAWLLHADDRIVSAACNPYEVDLDFAEQIDIDTPDDLALARAVTTLDLSHAR
jgi:hypothetical protein